MQILVTTFLLSPTVNWSPPPLFVALAVGKGRDFGPTLDYVSR
jgi:hypothetical protein